ncbi:MAG: DUF928 domain-containing protein [Cyanobacteriota bacterium]|nr:DUF928 domain-containing protein [Cyanobacteriota bacterium]
MIKMKLALAIALALIEITSCLQIAQAQLSSSLQGVSDPPPPPVTDRPKPLIPTGTGVSEPPPPPVDGSPPERQPAGTRGPCENTTGTPFTPLLPVDKSGFSGYTLTEHPTFWFYIPYKTSSVSSGKFSIEDQQGNTLYQTYVRLPNTPGFVSVSIPTTEKPLEKNKQYRWNFTLSCASQETSESPNQEIWELPNVLHTGIVQRVDMPALESQLKTATLEQRINLYVENGIWYDAPTDLAKSNERSQAWRNLLKSLRLEQLANEAIAGEVVPIVVPIEEGN